MFDVCRFVFAVCGLLLVGCMLLSDDWCVLLLFADCCLVLVVCCDQVAVWCLSLAVCLLVV